MPLLRVRMQVVASLQAVRSLVAHWSSYVLRMGIPACSRVVVDSDSETLHQATVVNGSHDFILQGSGPGAGKMSTVNCNSDVSLTFTNCQNIILLGSNIQFQACALSLTLWGPSFLLKVFSHSITLKHTPVSVLSGC